MTKEYKSLGLMSGTSGDGVDASIIQSEGEMNYTSIYDEYFEYNKSIFEKKLSYTADLRKNADIVENIIRQKLRWQNLMDNQKIHNPYKNK